MSAQVSLAPSRGPGIADACGDLYRRCDWHGIVELARAADPARGSAQLSYLHAYACWLLGRHRDACAILLNAVLRYPRNERLTALLEEIRAWRRNVEAMRLDELNGDGDPILELLGPQHLRDYRQQYGDPRISELCCLPAFGTDEEWFGWLEEQLRLDDQLVFAVIHREYGFVGSVSLILSGDVGMIYYWTGEDYRRRGFAEAAVRRLLAGAERIWGLRVCYAKVFWYNSVSRQLLEKLGFSGVEVGIKPPNEPETFYRLGPEPASGVIPELRAFLTAIESDIELTCPIVPAGTVV